MVPKNIVYCGVCANIESTLLKPMYINMFSITMYTNYKQVLKM